MKSIFTILFILFSMTTLFAQETKKVTDKISKYEQHEYEVLKSDEKTKHGYFKIKDGKKVEESGFYNMDLKDSIWVEYNYQGNIKTFTTWKKGKKQGVYKYYDNQGNLNTKGYYSDDQKTGEWEYYKTDGEIDYKYDYSKKELTYFNPSYDLNYKEIEDGDTLILKLEKPCIYVDGMNELYTHIAKKFIYPHEAKMKNIQGKVYVNFTVGADGKMKNIRILRGLGYGLDEEALYVIGSLPGEWSPAVVNGEKIEVQYNIPISCKLN